MQHPKNTVETLVPIRKTYNLGDETGDGLFAPALSRARLSAAMLQGEALTSHDARPGNAASDPVLLSSERKRAGLAIAWARKSRGISQGELASMLGVTTTTVCRWEKGHFQPSTKTRALLEIQLSELNSANTKVLEYPEVHQSVPEEKVSDILQACKLKIAALTGLAPEVLTVEMSVRLSA